MTVKLTLSIDEDTIQRAKVFSAKTGKSISKMVEEYLDTLGGVDKNTSSVKKISGLLKDKVPADANWKDIKEAYLKEKYGL